MTGLDRQRRGLPASKRRDALKAWNRFGEQIGWKRRTP